MFNIPANHWKEIPLKPEYTFFGRVAMNFYGYAENFD